MKSTIGAVILAGFVLAVPLAISLTAVATKEPASFQTVTKALPSPPEPFDDYYGYE